MFDVKSPCLSPLMRYRPLVSLLLPLCLAPLASCAEDRYLAQNYQTANPGYEQPSYSTPPPGYSTVAANGGQFLAPPQLADLVARIALYPDDLIGIILPASTYPLQVVQAARYLDAVRGNSTLAPDDSWDNAVVALLNYPDVVNMMDRELEWTERLGQAVIMQQADVIAAIGQFRAQAQAAGNLRSDGRQVVEYEQGAIRIRPANPQIIYVPQYEPTRVIVYQSEPVFAYYPRPCPVYYYNYSSGYPSGFTNFWGVSTMFTIGWSSRSVHLHDYDYYDDPRFDRPYNGYFYRRSHHDWHDDDRRWDDDEHGDGRGHGRPPRERDWQPGGGKGPRPIAVGHGGKDEPRDGGGRDPAVFTPPPAPRRLQSQDADSERRAVRPVTPGTNITAPATVERQPRVLEAPSAPAAMNTRRPSATQDERRQFEAPMENPAARFSAPAPRREERNMSPQRLAPIQAPPVRGLGNDDRDNARMAPSRPEPRMVTPSRAEPRVVMPSRAEPRVSAPSRQEMRAPPPEPRRQDMRAPAPRPEPRAPAASSRSSDGPASIRRGSDDDRARRDR